MRNSAAGVLYSRDLPHAIPVGGWRWHERRRESGRPERRGRWGGRCGCKKNQENLEILYMDDIRLYIGKILDA